MNNSSQNIVGPDQFPIPEPANIYQEALKVLTGLGPDFTGYSQKLTTLQQRLQEGSFHLAVLGQFKRGKSTLLNALIGETLLPAAVVPLTAIPTYIRFSPIKQIKVSFYNHPPVEFSSENPTEITRHLASFVTEEANPHNRKGVSRVDVYYPSPVLEKGVVLIDTPGVGSTYRHNTEMTLNFLPQCDAALFLVSADPPVTEVELEFLKTVQVKIKKLFFVVNKADYLTETEKDSLITFLKSTLQENLDIGDGITIFSVSARQGVQAITSGNSDLWRQSGMEELTAHLVNFLAAEKNKVLKEAVTGKTIDTLAEALAQLELALRSLFMPLTELEARIAAFDQKLIEVAEERKYAQDTLAGEWKRINEFLEEQAQNLRDKARLYLEDVANKALDHSRPKISEMAAQKALAEAIPPFFECELAAMSREFDSKVTALLQTYQHRADNLINSIRMAAAELFEIPYHAPQSSGALEFKNEPYWVTEQWGQTLIPIPEEWLDSLLPPHIKEKRIKKRLQELINSLMIRNVENLRWSTIQNLDTTFRRFGRVLDQRLEQTIAATHGAIKAAYLKRQTCEDGARAEIEQLNSSLKKLTGIIELFKELKMN
ncbi:MAG: dynamin family protein [Firmicutes bacterium]|nr:dynamin family protein [Bacillota bacterium]